MRTRGWLATAGAIAALALGGCLTEAGDVGAPTPGGAEGTPGGAAEPGGGGPGPTDPGDQPVGDAGASDPGPGQADSGGGPGTGPVVTEPEIGEGDPTAIEPAAAPASRSRRRMDLDQLSQAIAEVTGGIRWTEMKDGVEVDLFEKLARTLGKPDYLEQVAEDLEPTALFEKFLSDAARSVCYELVDRDLSVLPPQRILMRYVDPADTIETDPVGVDANLRVLLMRFHGRDTDQSSATLVPWRWLFESSTHVSGDPVVGWRTVCVGLITHPDFYSY